MARVCATWDDLKLIKWINQVISKVIDAEKCCMVGILRFWNCKSLTTGYLELSTYRTNSEKSLVKYICASTWNSTLKDLPMNNFET